jgi:hypothetical protein
MPSPRKNGGVHIRQSYDGIDFLTSDCLCYPPDTNIAVGNEYVVETVNKQMRIFDKGSGEKLLDEPLRLVFGVASFRGDPYAVYDDNADRWYITALDSIQQLTDGGLDLAIS